MAEAAKKDTGVVNIHGKQYLTVAKRISDFRENHPNYCIETEVLSAADLVQVKATIRDSEGRILSTGLAEEERGSTNINRTSALENAETSAVGRALAFFGLGGTEIASADEVANAIGNQGVKEALDRVLACRHAVEAHWGNVQAVRDGIALEDYGTASEAWFELDEDTKRALWLAPTKGGFFSTREREIMQSKEFREAHFGVSE